MAILYPFRKIPNSIVQSGNALNVSRTVLWEDACVTNDSINYDCYSKCGNGGAFETIFDFSNCVTISMLFNTSENAYGIKKTYTVLSPHNVSIVDVNNQPTGKYVVTPDVYSLCNDTVASVWTCLSTKCRSLTGCSWWLPYLSHDIYPSKLRDEMGSLINGLCYSVGQQLNSDIAGIGVS